MHSTTAIIGTKGLATSTQLATGQLLISGYLTRWLELDRQADRMVRGAFAKAIPAFLNGHAPLLYAHSSRDVLGSVLEMSEDEIGVKMVARVNKQPESRPLALGLGGTAQ